MPNLTEPTPAERRKQRQIKTAAALCLLFLFLAGLLTDRWLQHYEFRLASSTLKAQLNQLMLESLSSLQSLESSGAQDSISAEDVLTHLTIKPTVKDVRVAFDDGTFRQLNRGNPMHQYRVTADDSDAASPPLQMTTQPYWQQYYLAGREQDTLIWPSEQHASEFVLSIFLPKSRILILLELSWSDLIPEFPSTVLALKYREQPAISLSGNQVTDTRSKTLSLTQRWQSIDRESAPFWMILIPLIGLSLIAPIIYRLQQPPKTTALKRAVTQSQLLNHLCDECNLLLLVTDQEGTVVWRKGTLASDIALFQVHKGESIRRKLSQHPRYLTYLQQALNGKNLSYEVELENYTLRIQQWPNKDRDHHIHGITLFVHDISAQRQMEDKLRHEQHHDSLTGLPKRQLFTEQLSHELHRSRRRHEDLAVMALEVSGIGKINKLFGHTYSDQLLQTIAREITLIVRDEDSRCRYSNDEFLISVSDFQHPDNLHALAQRLIDVASKRYTIDGQEMFFFANVGIATYPRDARDVGSLINNAIIAMRHARQIGRNTLDYFSEENARLAQEKWQLEQDMSKALTAHAFELHYQPIFAVKTNQCIGAEALIRWPDARFEPNDFIPLAEESGLIHKMGLWALEGAMQQLSHWQAQSEDITYLSVNISALQLHHIDFLPQVESLTARFDLPPGSIVLEITESVMLHTTSVVLSTLQRLRDLGFRLAIDDFGTGFSSMHYLKHLPVDFLKVDKSFIDGIAVNTQDSAIYQAIIEVAIAMGIDIIAEGVETPEQMSWLIEKGVTSAQGYFYTQALPADEFSLYLQPK